jgi:hypothetical protein
VMQLLLGLAALAAVIAAGVRRWQKGHGWRRQPGATLRRAVAVRRFDEIDAALAGRTCWLCGGPTLVSGETSRSTDTRRLRVVRLVCTECERAELVYFDVTAAFH